MTALQLANGSLRVQQLIFWGENGSFLIFSLQLCEFAQDF